MLARFCFWTWNGLSKPFVTRLRVLFFLSFVAAPAEVPGGDFTKRTNSPLVRQHVVSNE